MKQKISLLGMTFLFVNVFNYIITLTILVVACMHS